MKYEIKFTSRYKKDYKNIIKRGCNIDLLNNVVAKLASEEKLPDNSYDHDLSGTWSGFRECHILPDWLLIYRVDKNILVLTLSRTGTHSDLFN